MLRGALTLSGIRLQQQLSSKYTNGTLRGLRWEAMSIPDLLDRGGRELHHWSGVDSKHLSEGGFDSEAPSYGLEHKEELR